MEGVQLKCEMMGGVEEERKKEKGGRRVQRSSKADSVEGLGGEEERAKSRFDQGSWFNSAAKTPEIPKKTKTESS